MNDVRIRPEFTINCTNGPIQQGDIVLKWQNPLGFNQTINYDIDVFNGNSYIGYWSFTQMILQELMLLLVKYKM